MNEFYKFITAKAGEDPDSAELLIFDTIGNWDDMGEVSAKRFATDLAKLPASVKRLDIHINSPGGSVAEAYGIYSRLADHRSEKVVYIDGLAASAASLVAAVGHKVYIRANANVMIHLPMALAIGNADDMRTVIAALESFTESMINVYAKRTKKDRDQLRAWMAAETWMHPEEAVANGFADEVRGVIKAAAVGSKHVAFNGRVFDLSRFHNIPEFSGAEAANTTMNTQPKAEGNEPANEPKPPTQPETPPPQAPKPETPPHSEPATPPVSPPPPVAPQPPAATSEREKGIQEERARIAALQKLDHPATHDLIVAAISDGRSANDITAELFEAMKNAGTQQGRRNDADVLSSIPPSDGGGTRQEADFSEKLTKAVHARVQRGNLRTTVHGNN